MNLLYPLGLLGLIGIPILIIIYIIKNKYTEQVISSTYIWTLSEKFLKKRNPINKLVGIISLILQILAVLFVSVAVAHPVFTVPDSANEYLFILDGSGSMNITEGSKTRLERGKDEIASLINGSLNGCTYTLVYAGTTTETVFDRTGSKEQALKLLSGVSPAYLNTGFSDALAVAQRYFNDSPWIKTYLVTDKVVREHENVEIVNARAEELARDARYREKFDHCCARAVARLNTLAEYCVPFIKKGGSFIAYKGDVAEEAEEAKRALKILGCGRTKIFSCQLETAGKRALFVADKTSSTPALYPRGNGKERKKPL